MTQARKHDIFDGKWEGFHSEDRGKNTSSLPNYQIPIPKTWPVGSYKSPVVHRGVWMLREVFVWLN